MALVLVLMLTAKAAQAETIAGTRISSFPYTITSSGLYHLTASNALFNNTNGAAILIQLTGAQKDRDVVLDLNDHTIAQTNRQYSLRSSGLALVLNSRVAMGSWWRT
jgi:hypothetical protein